MKMKNKDIAAQSAVDAGMSGRRDFLAKTAKAAAAVAIVSQLPTSLVLAGPHGLESQAGSQGLASNNPPVTPPPSKILLFETRNPRPNKPTEFDVTQWLFVTGSFTWSNALKMPMSTAITDPYGSGWLLAPMWKSSDFVDAAAVTKRAMGDIRNNRGPHIGVFQNPGSAEPRDGFVNLDGSVPFLTWGDGDPNNGAPRHSSSLADLLRVAGKFVVSYWLGAGTAAAVSPVIDGIYNYIVEPGNSRPSEDVVGLWHAKDGTMKAYDDNFQNFSPVLLSRRKPEVVVSPDIPKWPKVVSNVNGKAIDIADYMKIPRRSTLTWSWTGKATLGQFQVRDLKTGSAVIDRPEASTPKQDLTLLKPGLYQFRARNITPKLDKWLEITFSIV